MDNQLEVKIIDGKLSITIGVDLLCFAVQSEISDFKITNNSKFIEDIINELTNEEEDGTTPIHRMFDKDANDAIDNGSENVEETEE